MTRTGKQPQEEVLVIQNGNYWKIKKLYLIVIIFASLLSIGGTLVYPFIWKSQIDHDMNETKANIIDLQIKIRSYQSDIDEIKYNLKNYIEAHGFRYIIVK